MSPEKKGLFHFDASNVNSAKCPFVNSSVSFTLYPSSCLHLAGSSGAGKTTLANYIAGIIPHRQGLKMLRSTLGIQVNDCSWDESISSGERVGMLFQQTTLLDSLTVAGNVCVALENCPSKNNVRYTEHQKRTTIKQLLENVGLDYLRDGPKSPSELSGGMARRASLALQLAQHKHVIVLDEPFAGLDISTAIDVAKELYRLRKERGAALVLISHEPDFVDIVMGKISKTDLLKNTSHVSNGHDTSPDENILTTTVFLERRGSDYDYSVKERNLIVHPSLFGKDFHHRFIMKLLDYLIYSLPLIILTFFATGLAISMLSADILRRIDVTDKVLSIVGKEVKPLLKILTGEEDVSPLYIMMINMKIKGMLNETIPQAKATLYALGMTKLFVLEVGPLITALLLSGRIGGSYSGEVATMQSTSQNKLLTTLGISPVMWTFAPSLLAGWIAAPLLTMAGTTLALEIGAHIGPLYSIGNMQGYYTEMRTAITVPLRLRGIASLTKSDNMIHPGQTVVQSIYSFLDVRCTYSDSYVDTLIELSTHPICFHFIKSIVFISIIMAVAEFSARHNPDLTPKGVPKVITTSVVGGSLLVIFADWGFSQLLLKRQ